jgi:hypothetical protein
MRRAAAVDANQAEIVRALRGVGCSVSLLHGVGGGVPDLLVGRDKVTFLIEVKDGSKPPSARVLTQCQKDWWNTWRGAMPVVVTSVEEALAVVGVTCS